MNARERFVTSLTGGHPDRFVRYEHGAWPQTAARWKLEDPEHADVIEPYEFGGPHFGMDPVARIKINSGYTDSPYYPKYTQQTVEQTDHHRVYRDEDGIIKRELLHQRETSMPQFIQFPVSDRQTWESARSRLQPADAGNRIGNVQALGLACSNSAVPTMLPICGAFGHPRNLLGDEGLSFLIYDDPRLLDEILDNWLELYEVLLQQLVGVINVDVLLIWEDMCYRNGPLISPEHFRRFMLPRYARLISHARQCGIKAILVDTDGDCRKMIPIFLEAGVDAMMPFEVQAGMDVVSLGKEHPSLSIMGGIDKRVLASGSEADIRVEVERVLPYFKQRGGYIPCLDHTVPPNVPLWSYQYYLNCLREYE